MDSKNEKTFADLFSNSNLDSNNTVGFEGRSDNLENGIEQSVTFDNLINNNNNIKDEINDNNIDVNNGSVISADLNEVKEVVNDLFSNNLEPKEDGIFGQNNVLEDKNVFESTSGGQVAKENFVEEVNPFLGENVPLNKEEVVSNENKDLVDDYLDSNVLFEGNDIFGSVADDKKNDMQNNNSFFNGDSTINEENNAESINKLVEEANEKKNTTEEVNNSSVSPFFNNSNNFVENNNVTDNVFNNISVDETRKLNSKLDKIELNGTKNFNVKLVKKKISLLQFISGVISYAFFIFLVLVLVTLLAYVLDIKIRAAKGDYSAPKFNAYVVLTGSMLPEIKVKDVVVTKKVETNELEVGDIITFASSDSRFLGTIITHRIIKKNQDKDGKITFQTQGDNNNVADSALVQPNNIYGKVILKIPKLGYLQDFLATQGGWIVVILLPCVTVISYDIVKLSKSLKKRKNKINVIK